MCVACWSGQRIDTEEVRALASLIAKYEYDQCLGLHIVIDDWNLDDDSIRWCLKNEDGWQITPFEREVAEALLAARIEERESALALAEGFWSCPQ